jgi:hypothetical protein
MNRKQKVVVIIEAAVLAAMFVFPPYAGIDRESDGRIHDFLGYYPFWSPPSSEDVFQALRQRFPEELGVSAESMDDNRLSSFEPLFNKVHLIFNVTLSLLATAFLVIIFRNRAKR